MEESDRRDGLVHGNEEGVRRAAGRLIGITPDAPPLGRRYDIGGRELSLYARGIGGPVVVVETGAGGYGLDWLLVQAELATSTTCVLYDRAGYGWSDFDSEPRSAARTTDDLRTLLRVAGLQSPFVLVGHSLGGAFAVHFAQRFPHDVAGLVLVDPTTEAWVRAPSVQASRAASLERASRDDWPTDAHIQEGREHHGRTLAAWPEAVRGPLVERHVDRERMRAPLAEVDEDRLWGELRGGGRLPDVPLIVLTGLAAEPGSDLPAELRAQWNDAKRRAHAELAMTTPRGEHRVFANAGHVMHFEHSELIVRAVRDIVARSQASRR